MRAAVIGLGSMGRRRIRLLKDLDSKTDVVGIDLSKQRRRQAETELDVQTFTSLEEALAAGDTQLALVCTSPRTHAGIIADCLDSGLHTFTEINLVSDGYDENMALAERHGLVLFLSSTFLYRKETMRIAKEVAQVQGTYSYHVGQYLPDWHPWESWKDFFVADASTSGVRELLAIELPWIQHAFGPIVHIHSTTRHISGLEVPYDDSAILLLEHENGTVGTLTVDVVCRKAVRKFEFSNEFTYITWEGTPHTLQKLDLVSGQMKELFLYGSDVEHHEGYASFIVENAYRDELGAFVDAVEHGQAPVYGFAEDATTLSIIDEIEKKL